MKKLALSVCGLMLASLAPSSMFADTIFDFSFYSLYPKGRPDYVISGAGQLDTVATGAPGTFQVVGVSGTINTVAIAGLTPSLNPERDNLIFVNDGVASVDTKGLDWQLTDGVDVRFYFSSLLISFGVPAGTLVSLDGYDVARGGVISEVGGTSLYVTPASPTTAATPEPGSFLLLATGGLGLLGRATRVRLRSRRRA